MTGSKIARTGTPKVSPRRLAVGVLALAVLAPATYSIVGSLRELGRRSVPGVANGQEKARGQVEAPGLSKVQDPGSAEDPSEHCELQVFLDAKGGEPVVALTLPGKMTTFRHAHYGSRGRLTRELMRQAVLMAARDGMNLTVRDASVGDPMPKGKPEVVIRVDALCGDGDNLRLRLWRDQASKRVVYLDAPLREGAGLPAYRKLARDAEALARQGLPEALAKAGLKALPAPRADDGSVPVGVDGRLGRASFVEQFAALRTLHLSLRHGGASPRRLAALARGYANLGLLTDYQWDAAAKAYQARALLYAQRLCSVAPRAFAGRRHRGYALALVGSHRAALEDLDEAEASARARPEGKRPSKPAWAALAEAYCRYDLDALAARKGDGSDLAPLFSLLAIEDPAQSDAALRAARAAIDAEPLCFRAHDAACEFGGVRNLHLATAAAPSALDSLLPGAIATMPGLPPAALAAAQARGGEVALTEALDEASTDNSEPTWGALAKIVRETRFAFTFRRLQFMSDWWNVPSGDTWQELRPLVASHRFRPFLEAYVVGPANLPGLREFAAGIDTTDVNLNATPMSSMLAHRVKPPADHHLFGIEQLLSDWVVRDLGTALASAGPAQVVDFARKLLAVSPHSPYARGLLIENAWDEYAETFDKWNEDVGKHPTFLASLARRYVKIHKSGDAERVLRQYIALSPDQWAYQALAGVYKEKGDEAGWKSTLDEFLAKVEDNGLAHAQVQVEIAESLMKKGQFTEARPYADAAAESGAAWAMYAAQKCAEGLKDWDAAEKLAANRADRYPQNSSFDWIEFCTRTGQGDLSAASTWTLQHLDALGDATAYRPGDNVTVPRACLLMMEGEPAKGIAPLERLCEALAGEKTNEGELQGALLALFAAAARSGDFALADRTAKRYHDRFAESSPKFCGLLLEVRKALAKGSVDALDRKAVDRWISEVPPKDRGVPSFFVASYLSACGRHNEAKPYWQETVRRRPTYLWWRAVAASALRKPSGGEKPTTL